MYYIIYNMYEYIYYIILSIILLVGHRLSRILIGLLTMTTF
jgi:hypothetical protein